MPRANRKISHLRRILNEEPMGIRMIDTGMMIRFRYNRDKITDKNPLCLYLWRDKKDSLIHTINLNYLYPQTIEKLYRMIQERLPLMNKPGDNEGSAYTDLEFARTGGASARTLYEKVLKPKFLHKDDAYRTYKIKYITDIRAVHYDFKNVKGM